MDRTSELKVPSLFLEGAMKNRFTAPPLLSGRSLRAFQDFCEKILALFLTRLEKI